VVEGLGLSLTEIAAADFILLSGLDDAKSSPEDWRAVFVAAIARRLPMLCANPDLTMFAAGGNLIPAPGAAARLYRDLGGEVSYIGKPHPPIFAAALRALGDPAPERVLVVGDSLDHDVAGGLGAGMLTVLIAAGIHKEALQGNADLSAAVRELAGADAKAPHWVVEHLAW
jgi:HAD superfamily hydrolase (TIGR01459 family)